MIARNLLYNKTKLREYLLQNSQIPLTIGMICLVIGIILSRYFIGIRIADFLAGMFMGLSVVFNLTGLILIRKERTNKS